MSETPTKRAVLYLRVSTPGQVNTDYDPEGLSLPAQRDRGTAYAASNLGAAVVQDYVEPGVSAGTVAKRKVFRQMLADVKERGDIDYVLVWSVARWARDSHDYWMAWGMIRDAGAELASVTEPIGNSAYGLMMASVFAGVAAFKRHETSLEVSRGLQRKAEVGGWHGPAPLGYLNVIDDLGDRQVRTITTDPARSPLVALAFRLFATGDYSIVQLADYLAGLGLTSRGGPKRPPRPLHPSTVHRMLRNRAYLGRVLHKGVEYDGRHDPLVEPDVFARVQALLDAHRLSGNRNRRHLHFLRGSLVCDTCGSRMVYGASRSKNGRHYAYYFCVGRIHRNKCQMRSNFRVALVEQAVEDYYAQVQLEPHRVAALRTVIRAHVATMREVVERQGVEGESRRRQLKNELRLLLDRHYAHPLPADLFEEEQLRIQRQLEAAEQMIRAAELRFSEIERNLDAALQLAGNMTRCYRLASTDIRRVMNQVIFAELRIGPDGTIAGSELTEAFGRLLADDLVETIQRETGATARAKELVADFRQRQEENTGPLSRGRCSNETKMAEGEGFEPPRRGLPV